MRKLVFHPLLFAIAPVLLLYSRNVTGFSPTVIISPILAVGGLVLLCWLIAALCLRNIRKAAILISFYVLMFASFGHVFTIIASVFLYGFPDPGLQKALLLIWSILLVVGTVVCLRLDSSLDRLTRMLNTTGTILVVIPVVVTSFNLFNTRRQPVTDYGADSVVTPTVTGDSTGFPDIYYIILDGYARGDVQADIYDYPHSDLLDSLKRAGFYIAGRSCANYCQTLLSIASSLNFQYHGDISKTPPSIWDSRGLLHHKILYSRVVDFLRGEGYRIVAFATGYFPAELRTADEFIQPEWESWTLNEFQSGLLATTVFPTILKVLEKIPVAGNKLGEILYGRHRRTILHTLDRLADLPTDDRPRFVFAHVLAPHPPFLFDQDGGEVDFSGFARLFNASDGNNLHYFDPNLVRAYLKNYREQLVFIEKKVMAAIDAILTQSPVPPIVILQSDHGPGSRLDWDSAERTDCRERLGILNALYLPDGGDSCLYPTISPVNTFRVVLNHYFGEDLKLLPDKSYFSTWADPFRFIDVTDRVYPVDSSVPTPGSTEKPKLVALLFLLGGISLLPVDWRPYYDSRTHQDWGEQDVMSANRIEQTTPIITPGTIRVFWIVVVGALLGVLVLYVPLPILAGILATVTIGLLILHNPYWGLLAYLVVFLVRPQEIWTSFGGQFHIEKALALAVLASTFVSHKVRIENKIVFSGTTFGVLLFTGVIFLSVPQAIWRGGAVDTAIEFAKIAVLFFLVTQLCNSPRRIRVLVWVFLLCHLWIAGSTIYSYYTDPAYIRMGIQRAKGLAITMGNPNSIAASLAFSLPFALMMIKAYKNLLARTILVILVGLSVYGVIFTGSRSGMVTLIVLAFILAFRSRHKFPALIVTVGILLAVWSIMPDMYQKRFMTIFGGEAEEGDQAGATASAMGRLRGLRLGFKMFLDRPILGVGVGNFAIAWLGTYTIDGIHDWSQPHNMFAQLISELGLMGLISFAVFIVMVTRQYGRVMSYLHRFTRPPPDLKALEGITGAIGVALILLMISGLFGHNLYRYNWYFFAGILVAIEAVIVKRESATRTD